MFLVCDVIDQVMHLCFFDEKIKKKRTFFFYFITSYNQYFVQVKPGFTDFSCSTSSLGRLQNFVYIECSVWEKLWHITAETTPDFQERWSCKTKNKNALNTKDTLVYIYWTYIYMHLGTWCTVTHCWYQWITLWFIGTSKV